MSLPPQTPRNHWAWPIVGVLFALGVRVVVMAGTDLVIAPDGVAYLDMAAHLGDGHFHFARSAELPPLYPALIALGTSCGGDPERVARGLSLVLSALAALPLFAATARWFGFPVAQLTVFLYALYPFAVYHSFRVITEGTFLFFAMTTVWLCSRGRRAGMGWAPLTGIAIGLAYLSRVQGIILLVPACLWLAGGLRHRSGQQLGVLLAGGARVALVIIGFAIAASPYWTWYVRTTGALPHTGRVAGVIAYKATGASHATRIPAHTRLRSVVLGTAKQYTKQAFKYYVEKFPRAFGPLMIVLATCGVVLGERDAAAKSGLNCLVLFAATELLFYPLMWVNVRYMLPAACFLLPLCARGLAELPGWFRGELGVDSTGCARLPRSLVPHVGLIAVTAFMLAENLIPVLGWQGAEGSRQDTAVRDLGLWIREHCPAEARVAAHLYSYSGLTEYYAQRTLVIVEGDTQSETQTALRAAKADYLIVDEKPDENGHVTPRGILGSWLEELHSERRANGVTVRLYKVHRTQGGTG